MNLLKPKFRFCLFLVDTEKKKINQTICMAESYEIQQDGSIVFYQIGSKNDKHIKVPVLAYPKGKWEACILLDDNNEYPVFSQSSHFAPPQVPSQNIVNNNNNFNSQTTQQNNNQTSNNVSNELNDLSELNDFTSSTNNYTSSNNSYVSSNNSYTSPNNISNNANPAMIPGISQMNNPQEFKKMKTEWLEKAIMEYTKTQDFNVISFMKYLANDSQLKTYKPSENDIIWTAASLIQNKLVLTRKFSNPIIQKHFDLMLPNIMKRLWDGKMTPILTTLQEKEETKDANAIDLAVWMAKNNYS